jgi:hypothetical protein
MEGKHLKFFPNLKSLNVRQVELAAYESVIGLEEWSGLELKSLKVTVWSLERDIGGLAGALENNSLETLIVREGDRPDDRDDIDWDCLTEALAKNSGLKHLDLGISIPANVLSFLFRAVISCASKNTLKYVRMPFPLEYAAAGIVSALEKKCQGLKIEQINQHLPDCDHLMNTINRL